MALDEVAPAPSPGDDAVGYEFVVPDKPNGPEVGRLLRRTYLAGALGAGAALLALRRSHSPRARALALGGLVPGGGYAYSRSPLRIAATGTAFAGSLVAWFATGNIVAPPAIWAATALEAGRQAAKKGVDRVWGGAAVAVPAVVGGAAVAGAVARRRAFRAAQARGRERARYLAETPRLDPRPASPEPAEHTVEDLATLRSFLDRGLAPVDSFDGYDIIEQFQTSAIRYQLFMSQWVLALAQLHHTPSFRGYLSEAQRRLIDKVTLPRVWRYWALEQAWGNLSLDWDPMKKDNIMLSGYLGVGLGAYESNTGDRRYREPNSLPFRLGRRVWEYDHDALAAAVHRNMSRSGLTLYPCEPNWVYSACNMSGISTLLLSDRLHGTSYVDDVGDRFRRRLVEEFLTPDARITAIRSARLGLTIPALTSITADASTVTMLHAFDTEIARRTWAMVRREFIRIVDGRPELQLRGWDAIDVGNYQRGDLGAMALAKWAASEMGDRELVKCLNEHLDAHADPVVVDGARWFRNLSTQANAVAALGRYSPPSGYRDLIVRGPSKGVRTGPVLEGADYPEVQVAFADSDGSDLRLVLRPGAGDGRRRLRVSGLRPSTSYALRGAVEGAVDSDGRGDAAFSVDLGDRVEVRLTPSS